MVVGCVVWRVGCFGSLFRRRERGLARPKHERDASTCVTALARASPAPLVARQLCLLLGNTKRCSQALMKNAWFEFEERHIESISSYVSIVIDELRAAYLFRGHTDISWELQPSIDRDEFSDCHNKIARGDHERLVFEEFKLRARPNLTRVPANDWEFLALAQHHGAPTRLLDWSENPLGALFFAVETPTPTDSAVWCYSYVEQDRPLDVAQDVNPLEILQVKLYRPPHVHPRVWAQSGVFTTHPIGYKKFDNPWGTGLVRIRIPNFARPRLRVELQRMGVSRASLFPDLDGVGQHVYQKWRND